jgi:hypothetical protein
MKGIKDMAQDEVGEITMNHVAISGYKPLSRITGKKLKQRTTLSSLPLTKSTPRRRSTPA